MDIVKRISEYIQNSKYMDIEKIKLYLKDISDINEQDKYGKSILHYACDVADVKTIKLLLKNGIDPNLKDKDKNTAFIYFFENWTEKRNFISVKEAYDITKLFIENNFDVNIKTKYGRNSLSIVPNYPDYLNIMKLLLDHGADVNVKDADKYTILFNAVNIEMFKLLIKYGGDITASNFDGSNLLMAYSNPENIEIAKYLIKLGIDIDEKNNDGWTPLIQACQRENEILAKLLIEKKANVNAVSKISKRKGVFSRITTALFEAIDGNLVDIVKLLLKNGAKYDIIQVDDRGKKHSALTLATEREHSEIVEILLDNNVNVNFKTENGLTALDIAKNIKNKKIIKMIQNKKIEKDIANSLAQDISISF